MSAWHIDQVVASLTVRAAMLFDLACLFVVQPFLTVFAVSKGNEWLRPL